LKICSWRFVLWRFSQEIFPFMKMCSRRFIHRRLKCRNSSLFKYFFTDICPLMIYSRGFSFSKMCLGDFSFWICVCGDLSIEDWSVAYLSLFEDLFMKFCHLKIYSGDFSFYKDLFMEIYPLMTKV